ncbi:MAG: hypothetical protein NC421_00980 [Lachnospiraceae bacterium]|nr:hypothetical protein [Lachnospiraceae bacterium]
MTLRALSCIIIAVAAISCTGNGDKAPVPRRVAYPRVALYDSTYVEITGLPVKFAVNSSVGVMVNQKSEVTQWINIHYPRYGATARLTLQMLPKNEIAATLANRMERAMLDTGGYPTELTELTSPSGVASTIMLTPSATVTPLHFIATDSATFVLSGAVEFKSTDIEANAPAVNAIHADLLHAAKTITLLP